MKIAYSQAEKRAMQDADLLFETKVAELKGASEPRASQAFFDAAQEREDTIATINAKAIQRHFEGLGGDIATIFKDAKYQVEESSKMIRAIYTAAWDENNIPKDSRAIDQAFIIKSIQDELQVYYTALEGERDLEQNLLTDLLTQHIDYKVTQTIEQEKEIAYSFLRAFNSEAPISKDVLYLAMDRVTQLVFDDKLGMKEQRVIISGKNNQSNTEQAMTVTTVANQLIYPEDQLVYDAICTIYSKPDRENYDFITHQDIHNMINTGTTTYFKMSEARGEEIKKSVERLASKFIYIDLTEARTYKGLDQLPPEIIKRYTTGGNLIYAKYMLDEENGRGISGWKILADPSVFLLSSLMKQVATLRPEALKIPWQRKPKYADALIRYLRARINQADGRKHTIRLDTLYRDIRIIDEDKKEWEKARKTATIILDHWNDIKMIKGWNWIKEGKAITKIILNTTTKADQLAIDGEAPATE